VPQFRYGLTQGLTYGLGSSVIVHNCQYVDPGPHIDRRVITAEDPHPSPTSLASDLSQNSAHALQTCDSTRGTHAPLLSGLTFLIKHRPKPLGRVDTFNQNLREALLISASHSHLVYF
jgi:hypothetical protein